MSILVLFAHSKNWKIELIKTNSSFLEAKNAIGSECKFEKQKSLSCNQEETETTIFSKWDWKLKTFSVIWGTTRCVCPQNCK